MRFDVVAEREIEVRTVPRYRVINPVTGTAYAEGARTREDAQLWLLAHSALRGIVDEYEEVI